MSVDKSESSKSYGEMMSKFVKTNFPTTPEMDRSLVQLRVSNYVFHPECDPRYGLL